MNILFITHHYLSSNGGGSFASRAYINAFAEVADAMTLLYPVKEGQDVFPEINKKIHLVPESYPVSKLRKCINLFVGNIHRYYKSAPQLIKSNKFDYVVFDTSLVSYRLIDYAHRFGAKTIVIHHNYQFEYFRDNAKGLFRIPTIYWSRKYESEACLKSDINLTLSNQDSKLLCDAFRRGSQENFRLLGTFEYSKSEKRRFDEIDNSHRFVITGNLSAVQTEESLVPWLKEYYPILKEVFPDSNLTIAGKEPGIKIRQLCSERGITLIPSPESMEPIMQHADYYICPTALGGGIKLRVMDGLKCGLPVITHEVSARGYDLFVDKGCMLAYNDVDSFREALRQLNSLTFDKQSVYDAYLSIFSFEAGVERVRKIVNEL